MRCFSCCILLYTRNPNRRSSVLLFMLISMFIYILQYDVRYPYSYTEPNMGASSKHIYAGGGRGNSSCSYCQFYPVSGTAADLGHQCVKTWTWPSATVCIYDEWSDMYISHDLQYTGVWEPQVVRDFIEILGKNHGTGFIDLGANVGFYTLLAAKMGHQVIAVEPSRDSIYRIHRALFLEGLGDNVYVLENGISDRNSEARLELNGNNQGDHRLRPVRPCSGKNCPPVVKTITLDDLVDVIGQNFTNAIIKMDIQGFEHRAFVRASKLFDRVNIDFILMEWFLMTEFYVSAQHTSEDKDLVNHMISFLFMRDFRPFSLTVDGGRPLDPRSWSAWPFDIIWIRYPNPVEQRTVLSSHFRNWPS